MLSTTVPEPTLTPFAIALREIHYVMQYDEPIIGDTTTTTTLSVFDTLPNEADNDNNDNFEIM